MSEVILRVGRRGEIYTTKEVREAVGIREGGRVRAVVSGRRLIIEPIPSIEDAIRSPVLEISPEEAERISEEAQREEGALG
ncbi:MAG: AbrB/MazE/SpoVT family DNA-binding domain-containing protein [Thermoproteota archaeon]|nr:MAG: AbrB/MazE/SpoVT family DNA-binding domain-containing protein [Candidatus Korarchaeota archaeon]